MKRYPRIPALPIVCAAALLSSLVTVSAQYSRFFFRTDAGGTIMPSTPLKSFFGEPLAPGSKVEFDPGVRFGFAGGFMPTEWFAAELETGFTVNSIHSMTGASFIDDATFSNVPLLVNGRFQVPHRYRVAPYIGGGSGMSIASFHADHMDLGNSFIHGGDSTVVWAVQGFAGVRFKINDQMGLSVEYHYLLTGEPSWDAENTSRQLKFGRTETHSVSLAFDMKF